MATVSAPAKRAQRLRPAPLWLSLLLAFLAYFLLDFSLRLFYGSMSNVSLWAWQPLVFTLLWSGTMTAIAALLPRTGRRIFLLITFVPFALLAITNCVLYQLTGTCFSFADLALCRRRRAVYQRVLLPSEQRRVVQSRRLHGHDALRRDLHAEGAPRPPRPDRGRRAGGRVRGGHHCRPQCTGVPGR